MKVKMLQPMSGPTVNVGVGDIYECSAEDAKRLIDAEIAEPAEAPKPKDRKSKVGTEKRG
jgi:hypothetical protein